MKTLILILVYSTVFILALGLLYFDDYFKQDIVAKIINY